MNSSFSFQRFWQVFLKDLREGFQAYWLTMLIIVALPITWWLFDLMFNLEIIASPVARLIAIYFFVLLTVMMAPSRIYKYCNIPNRGVYFAMLPASLGEKVLSMVLITAVVMPLVVLVASLILDFLLLNLPIGSYQTFLFNSSDLEFFDFGEGIISPLLLISSCLFTAAVFAFTNTLFKKHKVTKTVLWSMLINFVLSLFSPILLTLMRSEHWYDITDSLSPSVRLILVAVFNLIGTDRKSIV